MDNKTRQIYIYTYSDDLVKADVSNLIGNRHGEWIRLGSEDSSSINR